jgi:hypothetical protein
MVQLADPHGEHLGGAGRSVRDPAAFERANYLEMLASHRPRPTDGPS